MGLIKATDALARRARAPEIRVPLLPAANEEPPFNAGRHELEGRVESLTEALAGMAAERDTLAERVAAREADLTAAAEERETAVAAAEARGRIEGFEDGQAAKAESLEVLRGAAGRAVDQLRGDLKGLETLAVALARAGLAKVFGEDKDMAARVARLVRRQLDDLERAAVLRVEVSPLDFADAAALDGLSVDAGLDGIEIKAVDGLHRGDCRLRLRLGEMEVGVGQQWARLSGLLDEAVADEAAA